MPLPITISLSPNTQEDDTKLALNNLFSFKYYKNGKDLSEVEDFFKKKFTTNNVFLFLTARAALYFLIKNLGLKKDNEVLLQAFTCVAVPEIIVSLGLKPVYIDLKNNGIDLNTDDFKNKITTNSRVLILQYTFGISPDIQEIRNICQKNNIFLIEDLAHIIDPIGYKSDKNINSASVFSFGRDKALSSVFGGVLIINNNNIAQKIKNDYEKLNFPSYIFILRTILHPILFNYTILPLYDKFNIGKVLLRLFLFLKIIPKSVFREEKIKGKVPQFLLKKYPNMLAKLILNQLNKIDIYNTHRKKIVKFYFNNLKNVKNLTIPKLNLNEPLLRFPIITSLSKIIFKTALKKNIYLGDWYEEVIAPKGVNFEKINYKIGNCKNAEIVGQNIINLPTHINIKIEDAKKIVSIIKNAAINATK